MNKPHQHFVLSVPDGCCLHEAKSEEHLGVWKNSSILPVPRQGGAHSPPHWCCACEHRSKKVVSGPVGGCYLSSLCPLCASLSLRLSADLLPSISKPHFFGGEGQVLCTPPDGKHGNMVVSQLTSKYSQALCEKVITDYCIQIRRKLAPCKAKDHQEWRVRKGLPRKNAPKWPSGSVSYLSLIRAGFEELKISLYRDGQLIFSQQIMAMINKLLLLIT